MYDMNESITLVNSVKEPKVISEEGFARILEPLAGPFLGLSIYMQRLEKKGTQDVNLMGLLANVIKLSSDVEHLLDRFHARNNRQWIWFRELTATTKNIGKATFLLEELKRNVGTETLFLSEETGFSKKATEITDFFVTTLRICFQELRKEGQRLGLDSPVEDQLPKFRIRIRDEVILPHTIEESDMSNNLVVTVNRIVHRYLEVARKIASLKNISGLESGELVNQIPIGVNEGSFRQFGTDLHNLQSWYDSYIFNHLIETEFPILKKFRQIFFAQLNLSKIATILSHYYERHIFVSSPVTDKLKEIVSSAKILEAIFYFTLHYSSQLSDEGKNLADSLLNALQEQVTYELPVPKKLGFHARPAAKVAMVVQHYGTEVKMLVGDQSFNASSVLELLSAGGYIITKGLDRVFFQGDKRTLDDLRILAENNYGETEDGKNIPLTEVLPYLG